MCIAHYINVAKVVVEEETKGRKPGTNTSHPLSVYTCIHTSHHFLSRYTANFLIIALHEYLIVHIRHNKQGRSDYMYMYASNQWTLDV